MPDQEDPAQKIMVNAPPVAGSAAEKAGIVYGDYIVAVNGVPTRGRTALDIIDQIGENPEAGSVTMTVLTEKGGKDGLGDSRDLTMARQFATIKNPVVFKMSERREDGTNVGYVRVGEFNSLVNSKLEEALRTLEGQGANAYVLDMRSNPGGAFQSAVEIAGLFMDDKLATSLVFNNVKSPFRTTTGKVIVDKTHPVAIWLDNRSASSTEVFAGAMHDQCRAVVMGPTNSFGKGLMQAVYGLQNGGGLVLTVARYVTPNGTDIQGKGISPDISTKLPLLLNPSDTSKVDFLDISARLKGGMCTPVS